MKTSIFAALISATVVAGCVLPAPPSLVTVRESEPTPVYVSARTYAPGYTVEALPSSYRTVRYGRTVYYQDRDVYYQRRGRGYVVVQRPY